MRVTVNGYPVHGLTKALVLALFIFNCLALPVGYWTILKWII